MPAQPAPRHGDEINDARAALRSTGDLALMHEGEIRMVRRLRDGLVEQLAKFVNKSRGFA